MHQQQTALKTLREKGEIARHEQFLLFPQCFLLNHIIISPFVHIIDIISVFAAEVGRPKISISGKRLTHLCYLTMVNGSFQYGPERVYKLSNSYEPTTCKVTRFHCRIVSYYLYYAVTPSICGSNFG